MKNWWRRLVLSLKSLYPNGRNLLRTAIIFWGWKKDEKDLLGACSSLNISAVNLFICIPNWTHIYFIADENWKETRVKIFHCVSQLYFPQFSRIFMDVQGVWREGGREKEGRKMGWNYLVENCCFTLKSPGDTPTAFKKLN